MYTTLTQKALTVLVAGTMLGGTTFGLVAPAVASQNNSEVSVTAVNAFNASVELTAFQQEILDLTNEYREKNDVAPVAWNEDIAAIAQGWATENVGSADFTSNPDYSSAIPAGWTVSAENISVGESAQAVFKSWVTSPAHSANLLNEDFTHFGVGYAQDEHGDIYVVQDFAAYPEEAEKVTVDEDATYSTDIAVKASEAPKVGDDFEFLGKDWKPGSVLDVTITSNERIPASISYAVDADGEFEFEVEAFEEGTLDVAVSYDVDGETETFEKSFTVAAEEVEEVPEAPETPEVEEEEVEAPEPEEAPEVEEVEAPEPEEAPKVKEEKVATKAVTPTAGAAALPKQSLVPNEGENSDVLGPGDEVDLGVTPDDPAAEPIAPPTDVTGPGIDESGEEDFSSNIPTFYPDCDAAEAAGVAPIIQAENPDLYEANTHLDASGEFGIACEPADRSVPVTQTGPNEPTPANEELADTGADFNQAGGLLTAGGFLMAMGAFFTRRALATARQNA